MPYSRTMFGLLCEQAARDPAHIAVIDGGRQLSYSELADGSARLASSLRAQGVNRGDRVGLLLNNRAEWLEACFGIMALGAVAVPFSTWSRPAELEFLLVDSEVTGVIAVGEFAGQDFAAALACLAGAARLRFVVMLGGTLQPGWIAYESFRDSAAPLPPLAPGDGASAGDDALVLYTSGSSARPKAVRLTQHALIENGFNIGERMGLTADDRVLLAPPLFWSYGAANALPATLSHRATLVLQPRFDPGEWIGLVERHRVSAVYTLPSMTGAVLRHPEFRRERTRSLRTGLMIGSPEEVRIAAEELGAAQICNIYGATETYGNCAVTPHDWPLDRRMEGQGPPLPGVHLRIVDPETGSGLPAGVSGAIEVAGYVTPGYSGISAAGNEAAFTADSYFRTGDIGFLDAEGGLHFVARGADIIKRAGINVSPAEVESLLLAHPAVAQAAVVGAPAGELGEAIVAFVVARPGMMATPAALQAHCRRIASSYKVPDRIEVRAALPVTETGKLFRRALREEAESLSTPAPGPLRDQ